MDGRDRSIQVGDLTLDPATLTVLRGDRLIMLSPVKFQIRSILAERPDQVVGLDDLHRRLWEVETPEALAGLRVHINRIPARLEPSRSEPRYLLTVRGIGHLLRASPENP